MKKLLIAAAILMVAGCGGTRIELNNGSGADIETLTVTIGENSETFHNIAVDETFTTGLPLGDSDHPVKIEWETAGETWTMEYALVENAQEASRISILFAPDQVNINYSF